MLADLALTTLWNIFYYYERYDKEKYEKKT